jgi:hypothetical protein
MAHFAQIDQNNNVLQVVVINNEDIGNLPFPESEPVGVAFCKTLFGKDTNWLQTSYNGSFRSTFAGLGGFYDADRNIFVGPPPAPEMTYDKSTGEWVDPAVEIFRPIVEANKDSLPTDEEIMARMSAMRGS